MSGLDAYTIDLKGMEVGSCAYEFTLDDSFFAKLGDVELRKGHLDAILAVKKTPNAFELNFDIKGTIVVTCDRCLDEMEQPIFSQHTLMVKFGDEYAEEDDNLIIIPETDGKINVAWLIYEFVVLAIPMKHVHVPGQCNKLMVEVLQEHMSQGNVNRAIEGNDTASISADSPWNELKKLLDNN